MDRRKFLERTAAGVVGLATPATPQTESETPAHDPVDLAGLHAYAERSVAAGEAVNFRVSSDTPYKLSVRRLVEVDDRGSDEVLETVREKRPHEQAIHPGSYVHVDRGFAPGRVFQSLTLETWVRAWSWERDQGLLTACDGESGFGLFVREGGWIKFLLGEWHVAHARLDIRRWRHLVLSWDGSIVSLFVDGGFQGSWAYAGELLPGRVPLRLGASGEGEMASHFLDGDLAMPVIYDRALSLDEANERYQARALALPRSGFVACWPFDEEKGDRVRDVSGEDHHGRIVNRATWMIGGPSFDAASVPRYGEYDPSADPSRGHGLRFASDDLYDCRWQTTHRFTIPSDAKSGVYVGRFEFHWEGKSLHYDVSFIVRKTRHRAKAPILMLCSTNTWQAYSATPLAKNSSDRFWETYGHSNTHPRAPAYCCYRNHVQGQPAYAIGMKMPWPAAAPDALFSADDVNYSHLLRAERFAHVWLERNGYEYDVISDHDLHRDPAQLEGYKVLVINGHSEYWSSEAYRAVDHFLRAGGAAIVMSGNTMFWRVSYDEDGTAMECRKYGPDIGGRESAEVGEAYHSHDGRRGSLMRFCGLPAWKVLGLECIGWWPIEEPYFGSYETIAPDHFLFQGPERIALSEGEAFGQAPNGELPRVGGHESDVRLGRIRQITRQNPTGSPIPEDPEGIVPLARVISQGRRGIDYFGRWEPLDHGVFAEMTYWERPQGGKVFHTGCIAGGWALSVDPKMQALMRNALHHFGVRQA